VARKPQKCLSCGAVVPKGDTECAVCGRPIKEAEIDTLMKALHVEPGRASSPPAASSSDGAEVLSLCGNCGAFVDARAKVCEKCGTDLGVEEEIEGTPVVPEPQLSRSTILCPECGAAMTQGMERCGVCGADLEPAARDSPALPSATAKFCDNCGAELAADGHCPLCTAIDAITAKATVSSKQAAQKRPETLPEFPPPPPVEASDLKEADEVEASFSSFLRPRAKPAVPPTLLAPIEDKTLPVVHALPPKTAAKAPPPSSKPSLPTPSPPSPAPTPATSGPKAFEPPPKAPPAAPARIPEAPKVSPPPVPVKSVAIEKERPPARAPPALQPSIPAKTPPVEKARPPAKLPSGSPPPLPAKTDGPGQGGPREAPKGKPAPKAPAKAPEKPAFVIPPPPGTPRDEDLELPEEIPAYSTFTFGAEDEAQKPAAPAQAAPDSLTEEEASEVALVEALDDLEEVVEAPAAVPEPVKAPKARPEAKPEVSPEGPPKKRPPKSKFRPPPPIEVPAEVREEAPVDAQVWGEAEIPEESADRFEEPVVAERFARTSLVAPTPPRAVSTRLLRLGELSLYASVFCLAAGLVVGQVPTPDRGVILLALFGVDLGVAVTFLAGVWRGISRRGRWARIAGAGAALLAIVPVIAVLGLPLPFLLLVVMLAAAMAVLLGGTWRIGHPGGVYVPWAAGAFVLFFLSLAPFVFPTPGTALDPYLWILGAAAILAGGAMAAEGRLVGRRVSAAVERARPMHQEMDAEASISRYDRALALGRRTATGTGDEAWTSKGAALVLLGRYDEAIECLDQALQINPDSELAWLNRGNALARKGLTKDALSAYNRAIQANSRYEVAWNNKGNTLARLGNYNEALRCYDRALELDVGYRSAWVNKGFVLAKMGYYEEAAQCADKVLSITGKAAAVP